VGVGTEADAALCAREVWALGDGGRGGEWDWGWEGGCGAGVGVVSVWSGSWTGRRHGGTLGWWWWLGGWLWGGWLWWRAEEDKVKVAMVMVSRLALLVRLFGGFIWLSGRSVSRLWWVIRGLREWRFIGEEGVRILGIEFGEEGEKVDCVDWIGVIAVGFHFDSTKRTSRGFMQPLLQTRRPKDMTTRHRERILCLSVLRKRVLPGSLVLRVNLHRGQPVVGGTWRHIILILDRLDVRTARSIDDEILHTNMTPSLLCTQVLDVDTPQPLNRGLGSMLLGMAGGEGVELWLRAIGMEGEGDGDGDAVEEGAQKVLGRGRRGRRRRAVGRALVGGRLVREGDEDGEDGEGKDVWCGWAVGRGGGGRAERGLRWGRVLLLRHRHRLRGHRRHNNNKQQRG
jgi:hypothetical protein